MVLESKNEDEIKFIQFNDESSLNAISSEDWNSLTTQISSHQVCKWKLLSWSTIRRKY